MLKALRLLSLTLTLTALACNGEGQNQAQAQTGPASPNSPFSSSDSLSGFTLSAQKTYAVKIVWNSPPISDSFENSADVYFVDIAGNPLSDAELKRFSLFMVTMGHPSSMEREIVRTKIEPGHWKVSRILFSMGGPSGSWVVNIEATTQNQSDKAQVSVEQDVQ